MPCPSIRRWFAALWLATVCCWSFAARAQHSQGVADDGLTGFGHVGLFDDQEPSLSLAGTVGFGLIEEQPTTTGSTTRLMGRLGVGVRATEWFAASLYLDGRYDSHPDDAMGPDDSMVGDPELRLRAGTALDSGMLLGAEVAIWVPGRDAPSIEFAATTLQLKALLGYRMDGLVLAANLGFRLDNSASSIDDAGQLRPGDRISLGVSDFNAIPIGLAAAYQDNSFEVFGAVHLAVLLGDVAEFMNSPLGADLGLRYALSDSFGLELRGEASFSSRPTQGPTDPLVRIDPRFAVFAGVRYGLGFSEPPPIEDEEFVEEEPPPPQTGTLTGVLRGEDDQPIPGATVTVKVGNVEKSATSDEQGNYEIADVPLGTGTLTVRAEGFDETTSQIKVEPGVNSQSDIELTESTPSGQLRGLVRSFAGEGVPAKITVSPGDISAETEQDGSFEIDIAPGSYEVTIEAKGYTSQTRSVSIDENGVTVLNVELRKSN